MNEYLVEFMGAVVFVYTILATGHPLAIGAVLTIVIYLTSKISGGHINPIVSIVMALSGKLPLKELIPYVVVQILGALAALQLYKKYNIFK